MFSIADGKVKRFMAKPINTEAINNTPSYKVEIQAHIAGLFSLAGGNISVLYGYSSFSVNLKLVNPNIFAEISATSFFEKLSKKSWKSSSKVYRLLIFG